jgi:hypothetical protein
MLIVRRHIFKIETNNLLRQDTIFCQLTAQMEDSIAGFNMGQESIS